MACDLRSQRRCPPTRRARPDRPRPDLPGLEAPAPCISRCVGARRDGETSGGPEEPDGRSGCSHARCALRLHRSRRLQCRCIAPDAARLCRLRRVDTLRPAGIGHLGPGEVGLLGPGGVGQVGELGYIRVFGRRIRVLAVLRREPGKARGEPAGTGSRPARVGRRQQSRKGLRVRCGSADAGDPGGRLGYCRFDRLRRRR